MFREFLVSGGFNLCLELITQVEEDSVNMSLEMYVFNPHIPCPGRAHIQGLATMTLQNHVESYADYTS